VNKDVCLIHHIPQEIANAKVMYKEKLVVRDAVRVLRALYSQKEKNV